MRYYQLSITNPGGQVIQVEQSGLGFTTSAASSGPTFSSTFTPYQTTNTQAIGRTNPNALNIEFDLPVAPQHELQNGSLIRIWGLGIKCLSQAANLNPVGSAVNKFSLRAGMAKGLPLANPSQQGLLISGEIWQAFGAWVGTEQVLNLIVQNSPPPSNNGVPIAWNWLKGQNLQSALTQMLSQAFPSYQPEVNISPSLVATSTQSGPYPNIDAFFKWLKQYTRKLGSQIYGSSYPGVSFVIVGNTIQVADGTVQSNPTVLAFQDLIGQPGWIGTSTITFPTVLRGDIDCFDLVRFPSGTLLPYVQVSPDAAYPGSPAASNVAFKGTFLVNEIHHYGNFRQADAASWNTTFQAVYQTPINLTPTLS